MLSIILGMTASTSLFPHIKLHQIFISGMAYRLKETPIFEISVLKDFVAINSDVDFIENFQGYQNGSS